MFDRLRRRHALIVMQRTENKEQGRPVYAGTGKKGSGCPLDAVIVLAGSASTAWTYVEVGSRWLT